jgi:hypothetical protein
MALSFTERFRHHAGGRTFLYLDVGQDEATSTFTAASIGLTYLDFAGCMHWSGITSGPNDTSVYLGYVTISVIADGTQVEQGVPMKLGSTKHLLLIGW